MILRNNSKNEWLNYHQGIDIKAESTFEVPQKEGKFILKMLGHENWVVEVKAEEAIKMIKEAEEVKTEKAEISLEENPAIKEVLEKEEADVSKDKIEIEEIEEKSPKKRPEIMKELKEKGIKFNVSMKNAELLELLK